MNSGIFVTFDAGEIRFADCTFVEPRLCVDLLDVVLKRNNKDQYIDQGSLTGKEDSIRLTLLCKQV